VAGAEGRECRGRYLILKHSRIWSGSERSRGFKIKKLFAPVLVLFLLAFKNEMLSLKHEGIITSG